jgi:hypothetical protein
VAEQARSEAVAAMGHVRSHLRTHLRWRRFLSAGNDLPHEKIGDLAHHRKAIAELNLVARVVQRQIDAEGERLKVVGFCPMGCGKTLFVGEGGHITCSHVDCSNREAVDEILDVEETEHLVKLDEDGFRVLHPLRERLTNELLRCTLHSKLEAEPGMPAPEGTYRAIFDTDLEAWLLEEVDLG